MKEDEHNSLEVKIPSETKKTNKPSKKSLKIRQKMKMGWAVKIFIFTLLASLILSIGSEFVLTQTGFLISCILIFVFILINAVFDMVGVAATAAQLEPFVAMASKKVAGAKEAIYLVKNADKVASFACDIVGDVCGILSGALGAGVLLKLYSTTGDFKAILLGALISSIVAAFTVFSKALAKGVSTAYPEKIIFATSKILHFFKFSKRK